MAGNLSPASLALACSLNGVLHDGVCDCDAGWKGPKCERLDLAPVAPAAFGVVDSATPTWGGGARFHAGRWYTIVGARAVATRNNAEADYPCDSKIVLAVSRSSDPAGPYAIESTLVGRSAWEPSLATDPVTGALVLMFYGNASEAPPVGSPACRLPRTTSARCGR